MIFTETKLSDAFLIDLDRKEDARGYFARVFCAEEFRAKGLNPHVAQCSISFNPRKGTLRGMHWQAAPKVEAKLIRCTRGVIFDVIVDLRPESPTRLQHVTAELSQDNGRMLYIPEGLAHGFQTLADDTEVFYQMSEFFAPECGRGARWNDPAFCIKWPLPDPIMNDRDRSWPDFR
ncbi:MAG TPA: dTDP-4-dehydrorhamnose 3,5-epimerase [Candidatus Udaeobacter sp.]